MSVIRDKIDEKYSFFWMVSTKNEANTPTFSAKTFKRRSLEKSMKWVFFTIFLWTLFLLLYIMNRKETAINRWIYQSLVINGLVAGRSLLFKISNWIGMYSNFVDFNFIERFVCWVNWFFFHQIKCFPAIDDFTKCRVWSIEMVLFRICEEELTEIRIRSSVCHAQHASFVMLDVCVDFILEWLVEKTFTTSTCVGEIASLHDESANASVKNRSIVIASCA